MEEKLLDGVFQMLPLCNEHNVIITRQNIIIREYNTEQQNRNKFISILIENIIGSKIFESKIKKDPCVCFQLVTLVKNKKGIRERKTFTFRVTETTDKQESYTIAETWARTIAWLARDATIDISELQEKENFPPRKKFFIFLNPKSGKCKTLHIFRDVIEPLFKDATIDYEVCTTEYAGHCTKLASTSFDYKKYDAVIISSGDGMVYEYINGIMSRDDYREALKLPIGILPTGSGNALSASIMHSAKEALVLSSAIYILLKGSSHPMDLFRLQSPTKTYFGFLSVTWGIMSDVDIESEKYRKLGAIRFTLGALQRILGLRHYRAKFSYLPCENKVEMANEEKERSNTVLSSNNMRMPALSNGELTASDRTELNIDTPSERVLTESSTIATNGSSLFNSNSSHCNGAVSNDSRLSTLPSLNEPLPEGWITRDEEFVTIGLCSMSHLGLDMHASPKSLLNDNRLIAIVVRKGVTKKRMLDILSSFEVGEHVNFPEVEMIELKAFRLEPDLNGRIGNLVVDGELIDYTPLQAEMLPSLANVITLPNKF